MPCSDDGPTPADYHELWEKHQITVRLACDYCRRIEDNGVRIPVQVPDWAQHWWDVHKEHDRNRIQAEESRKVRDQQKRSAYNKLTPDERDAVGMWDKP